MLFWHGGNLNNDKPIKHKGGRYEYGPGLYATTHYETAQKYSKGSRKLYLLDIQKGNELSSTTLPAELLNDFVKSNVIKAKLNEITERLKNRTKNDRVPAHMFVNILLNEEAIKPSKMNILREFLVDNGIDYELVSSPFGWNETMIILYNMGLISKTKQITPKDKIKEYDLSKLSESESMKSVVACSKTNKIARILCISESLVSEYTNQKNIIASNLKIESWDEYSDDYDPWKAADQAEEVANKSEIKILRDKELSYIVLDESNNVVGAAWTSLENNENDGFDFSFDVAILPKFRGAIGIKLIDTLINDFDSIYNEHPNSTIQLDVVNPKLVSVMKRKYGFKIEEEYPGHTMMKKANKTSDDDYMGEHKSPTKSANDAPIYDVNLNGIYPDDIYEGKGHQYIFEKGGDVGLSVILESHNKPNAKVTIYRTIPDFNKDTREKDQLILNTIHFLEALKNHKIVKRTTETQKLIFDLTEKYPIEKYDYETQQDLMIKDLKEQRDKSTNKKDSPKIKIEKGNWVSPSKQYAIQHGKSNLNNEYRVISKTVKAKDLYTDGNSLNEWGYDPQ